MVRVRHVLCLLLVQASLGTPGRAQEPPELVTDRPDQTESAVVVPKGAFQLELGANFARDAADGVTSELLEVPSALVRYGLSPRLELRLAWAGVVDAESRGRGERARLRGTADPEIGLKLLLLSMEQGDAWSLALLSHATIPVGDEEVGSPRADPSLRVLGAHELSERVGFGWNVGYEAGSFRDAAGDRHTLGRFVYTGSLGIALNSRWGTFLELFGDLPASDPEPEAHSFDAGLTFLATPRLQLDVAAGVGLNGAAVDWFVGSGLSFRW